MQKKIVAMIIAVLFVLPLPLRAETLPVLTLQQAQERALQHSKDLRLLQSRLSQAGITADKETNAYLDLQESRRRMAVGSASDWYSESLIKARIKSLQEEYDTADPGRQAQIEQELKLENIRLELARKNTQSSAVDFSALSRQEEAAELTKNMSRDNYENTKDSVADAEKTTAFQTARTYVEALLAREQALVQREQLQALYDRLRAERLRESLGLTTRAAVQDLATSVAEAEKQLTAAEGQYKVKITALNDLMGTPAETRWELKDIAVQLKPAGLPDEILAEANAASSQLKRLERQAERLEDRKAQTAKDSEDYDLLLLQEDDLQTEKEKVRQNLVLALQNLQNRLRELERGWLAAQNARANAELKHKHNTLLHELGLLSRQNLLDSRAELQRAVLAEKKGAYDYYLTYENLLLLKEGIILP